MTEHPMLKTEPVWRKSSYSGNQGGACIEVAADHGAVRIRDSKHPSGPQLATSVRTWATFVSYAAKHTV